MKLRSGFISNSSSCSFIISFPKNFPKQISQAKLEIANPPIDNLQKLIGLEKETIEKFLSSLTIDFTDEKITMYNISIPFYTIIDFNHFISIREIEEELLKMIVVVILLWLQTII